jgi:hypothetical protein
MCIITISISISINIIIIIFQSGIWVCLKTQYPVPSESTDWSPNVLFKHIKTIWMMRACSIKQTPLIPTKPCPVATRRDETLGDGRLVSYDKGHHEEPFGTTKVGCDGLSGRVGVRSNNTFHLINS